MDPDYRKRVPNWGKFLNPKNSCNEVEINQR